MIVIDVDSIKNEKARLYINNLVKQNLTETSKTATTNIYKTSTPIYWFSKNKLSLHDLVAKGLPKIGTIWCETDVPSGLNKMVNMLDDAAHKFGMIKTGKFRRPVYVFSNENFDVIERFGATPLPAQLFEGNHGL